MRAEAVDPTYAGAAAVSGVGSVLTAMSDVALHLLGVPLPVVMAAAAGAFLARAYLPPTGFGRALCGAFGWTVAGCALAPVVQAVSAKMGYEIPAAGIAGLALSVTSIGPFVFPIIIERAKRGFGEKQDGKP